MPGVARVERTLSDSEHSLSRAQGTAWQITNDETSKSGYLASVSHNHMKR